MVFVEQIFGEYPTKFRYYKGNLLYVVEAYWDDWGWRQQSTCLSEDKAKRIIEKSQAIIKNRERAKIYD